jgi:hypothetical protein
MWVFRSWKIEKEGTGLFCQPGSAASVANAIFPCHCLGFLLLPPLSRSIYFGSPSHTHFLQATVPNLLRWQPSLLVPDEGEWRYAWSTGPTVSWSVRHWSEIWWWQRLVVLVRVVAGVNLSWHHHHQNAPLLSSNDMGLPATPHKLNFAPAHIRSWWIMNEIVRWRLLFALLRVGYYDLDCVVPCEVHQYISLTCSILFDICYWEKFQYALLLLHVIKIRSLHYDEGLSEKMARSGRHWHVNLGSVISM